MYKWYDRRTVLRTGGIGATALLAGCIGTAEASEAEPGEETFYIVAYHWGFAAFDVDGTEHESIEVPEGTELTLVAVNDHASDAFDYLPCDVEAVLKEFDALERTQTHVEDGIIPEPDDVTIEEKYEEAHDDAHRHDEDDDHHEDDDHDRELTMLDHEVIIPGYDVEMEVLSTADKPVRTTFVTDETGTFDFLCTHDCGYGHPYMVREMLRVE